MAYKSLADRMRPKPPRPTVPLPGTTTNYYTAADEVEIQKLWPNDKLWRTLDGVQPSEISDELWAKFCHCKSRKDGYSRTDVGIWVHASCHKPRPHFGALLRCDNCDRWYCVQKIPDRLLMCPACANG